jgi:hypothetical protein
MSQGGFTKTALTLITTKGDLLTHSTIDTRLPVGADGTYLKADSAEPTGLRWAAGGGGGGGDVFLSGSPVNNQLAVWISADTIEGDSALTFDTSTDLLSSGILRATSFTASEMVLTDSSKNLVSAPVATYPSLTELTYVKGVTSAIQTQINAKQASDATLTALAAYNTNGLLTQTAADIFTGRTMTGTPNEISVADGDGVSGNPTLSLPATIDLGGKTSLEIPNSAAPSLTVTGQIAVDSTVTDFSGGLLKYYDGVGERGVIAMPIAQFTSPTNGHIPAYNSTNDVFELVAQSGGGSMPVYVAGGTAASHDVNTSTAFAPIVYRDFGSVEINVRAFDTSTTEYMQGFFKVPTNLGTGNVTFRIIGSASTAAASKNVKFTFDFLQVAAGAAMTGAYSGAEVWDDQAISGTQDYQDIISNTETVANLGWVAGRMVYYRLYRSTATTNNLASDYHVISFYIDIPQA